MSPCFCPDKKEHHWSIEIRHRLTCPVGLAMTPFVLRNLITSMAERCPRNSVCVAGHGTSRVRYLCSGQCHRSLGPSPPQMRYPCLQLTTSVAATKLVSGQLAVCKAVARSNVLQFVE